MKKLKEATKKKKESAPVTVVGFKGFDKDFKCRDFQFEVGKEYKHDGPIEICNSGFHFCEDPLNVLNYYPVIGSKFAEIETSGNMKNSEDGKSVTDHIKIKAQLDLPAFIRAAVEFTWKKATTGGTSKNSNATSGYGAHSATSGNRANSATSGYGANSATSGYGAHSATSGYGAHSATSGEYAHSATSGNDAHSATSGNRANSATSGYGANSATSGYGAHSATSGNDAHSATSGEYAHSATSGNRANSATSGYGANSATSGNDAIACAVGRKASAKGTLGCWIVVAEWEEGSSFTDAKPVNVLSAKIDGKKVKADTWYKVENGKFVEVKE